MDYGPGFGGPFGHIVGFIVSGLFTLFVLLVVIALLFLLVRFLLMATKAAQIYVAKNSPAAEVKPAATPAATAPTTVAPVKPAAPAKPAAGPAATKPAPKPRTPKTP